MKSVIAALMLSAAPAMALDITAMTPEEKAAFGQAVRDYLMENPEVLIESINVLEERRASEDAQNDKVLVAANTGDLFNDGHSWEGGNPQGDVTMVAFIDYRCSWCRRIAADIHDVTEKDGNIRLILKEFPILGQDSEASSRFAVAVRQVAGDEAYMRAHDALMEMRGPATLEALKELAADLGVDGEAVVNAMNTEEVSAVLRANRQLADRMRIMGTPTFVIGEELLRGVPPNGLAAVVAEVRESRG